ncbi:GIY-YIG catalytic domain-containing protein [Biscogniauxia mediterranea]|nr:GIY-YIG catalytic domain-containing protein [Biscogniauxia mediterranea]
MSVLLRPIPPFYAVYVLRSTVRNASLYIGSTPNPPRRLKQHNGEVVGGAARTAVKRRQPWEMIGLVSGFPSMVAALKFEWAINNPHRSLHIPHESRITVATQRHRNGRLRRPPKMLTSIAANLHLLLRMPSFARLPLAVHFFDAKFHTVWEERVEASEEQLRPSIRVHTDFGPSSPSEKDKPWGIHALPLDYDPIKEYVRKAQSLHAVESEPSCLVCGKALLPGRGLYATCPNAECDGTGHVSCWSRNLLRYINNDKTKDDEIIPVEGRCPKCRTVVNWGVMMKEMSLRVRGSKEVDKLLSKKTRKPQARADKLTTSSTR